MANPDVLASQQLTGSLDPVVRATRAALAELFGPADLRSFAVRLWDGTVEPARGVAEPHFTVVLNHPGALRRMVLPPSELRLAEAYIYGDVDVEGSLEEAAGLAEFLAARVRSVRFVRRLTARLLALPSGDGARRDGVAAQHSTTAQYGTAGRRGGRRFSRRLSTYLHSRRGDRAAVRFHYDLSNDFYRLWLDRRMVYSCAYFPTGIETLDEAQEAKLDLICRKLRLRPGERLLDIGCGWGGLIRHAAVRYGVDALGITLSQRQADLARELIAADGLEGRCRVEVRDYRELAEQERETFDKVVSVGMFEHVGRSMLPTYFAAAYRLTRPGGLFLNHGIVELRSAPRGIWRRGAFIARYVFPGGKLVRSAEAIAGGEAAGFETRDVESLREHYAMTLRHWVRRLEERHDEAARLVGEPTYRVWRLYMAGAARSFATGRLGLQQALFAKPDSQGRARLPLTRADLYR